MYKVLGRTFQNPTHALMALFSWARRGSGAKLPGKIELETGEAIAYYTINKIDLYDPYWKEEHIRDVVRVFGAVPENGYRHLRELQIDRKKLVDEHDKKRYRSVRLLG